MTSPYNNLILAEPALVSYWPLSDTSGTTATEPKDSNPGTYTGGFTLGGAGPTEFFDGSTAFNGSTGYVTVPNNSNLNLTTGLSVECWIKLAGLSTGSSHYPCPIEKYDGAGNGYLILIKATTNEPYFALLKSSVEKDAQSPTALTTGRWYHLVGTYDNATERLYVNGVLVAETAAAAALASSGTATLRMGNFNIAGATGFVNGSLAGVAVYNQALTPNQVYNHYKAGGFQAYSRSGSYSYRPVSSVQYPWNRSLFLAYAPNDLAKKAINLGNPAPPFSVTGSPNAAGTFIGGVTKAIGNWGPHFHFDGSANCYIPTNSLVPNGTKEITVSILARTQTFRNTASNSANIRYLLAQQNNLPALGMRYFTLDQTAPQLMDFIVGSNNEVRTTIPPSILEWNLYTGRFNGNTLALDLFYNRLKVATAVSSQSSLIINNQNNDEGILSIGGTSTAAISGASWLGDIAAVYVWTRALSDQEIVNLSDDPFAPVRPALSFNSIFVKTIINQSISQSFTFTSTILEFDIHTQSISQSLTFSHSITGTLRHTIISQSLPFTSTVSLIVTHNRTISQSISFNQSITSGKTIIKSLSLTLNFTFDQDISQSIIKFYQFVNNTLVFLDHHDQPLDIHSIGTNLNGHIIKQPNINAVIVPKRCSVILSSGSDTIVLPCPLWGDSEANVGTMTHRRTMTGLLYTYVKSSSLIKLNYRFEITRKKSKELLAFLKNHMSSHIEMINFKGEHYYCYITNNPIDTITKGLWFHPDPNCNTEYCEVNLEFEGARI